MQNERVRRNLAEIHAYIDKVDLSDRRGKLCEMHYHDEIEFLLITHGTLSCIMDGGTLTASAGQVIFVDSRVPHWTASGTDGCGYILLQFSPEELESRARPRTVARYLYSFTHQGTRLARLIRGEEIADDIRAAWDEYAGRQVGAGRFILSHLFHIMGHLERSGLLTADSLPDEQTVQKLLPALEYIDQNYSDPELSLERVSGVMGLNPAYFCRLFKRSTGHGFTEYLNFVRVSKSEELLQTTSLSVLDISLEVGFASVSYYNRIFKRIKNCTPTVYRSALYSALLS